jgi:hypothetical protein
LGRTIVFNTAFDTGSREKSGLWSSKTLSFGRVARWTAKSKGSLTPGLVLDTFPLAEPHHFGFGAGLQIAATQFHQYNHRWILSVQFPF